MGKEYQMMSRLSQPLVLFLLSSLLFPCVICVVFIVNPAIRHLAKSHCVSVSQPTSQSVDSKSFGRLVAWAARQNDSSSRLLFDKVWQ